MHLNAQPYFDDIGGAAKELRQIKERRGGEEHDAVRIEKLLLASFLYVRKLDDHDDLPENLLGENATAELLDGTQVNVRWLCGRFIHSRLLTTGLDCFDDGIEFASDCDPEGTSHRIAYDQVISILERYGNIG